MEYKITGTVYRLMEAETFTTRDGASTFTRRSLLIDATYITTDGRRGFDNFLEFEFSGERVKQLDGLTPGERVAIGFAPTGRLYNDREGRTRCFQRLAGLSLENLSRAAPYEPDYLRQPAPPSGATQPAPTAAPPTTLTDTRAAAPALGGDLPF